MSKKEYQIFRGGSIRSDLCLAFLIFGTYAAILHVVSLRFLRSFRQTAFFVARKMYLARAIPLSAFLNRSSSIVIGEYPPMFSWIEEFSVVSWAELLIDKLVNGGRRHSRKSGALRMMTNPSIGCSLSYTKGSRISYKTAFAGYRMCWNRLPFEIQDLIFDELSFFPFPHNTVTCMARPT